MTVDLRPPGLWEEMNEKLAQGVFQLDVEKNSINLFWGLQQGLIEITQGLSRQFINKKKVFYVSDLDPLLEDPVKLLARQGYQIQRVTGRELQDPSSLADALDRETLLFLAPLDDPLLGQSFGLENLQEQLKEQKVFKVFISHALHRQEVLFENLGR